MTAASTRLVSVPQKLGAYHMWYDCIWVAALEVKYYCFKCSSINCTYPFVMMRSSETPKVFAVSIS